jgi:hypothetical protein
MITNVLNIILLCITKLFYPTQKRPPNQDQESVKTPTALLYHTGAQTYENWGQEAMERKSSSKEQQLLRYFKLSLVPEDSEVNYSHSEASKKELRELKDTMYDYALKSFGLHPVNVIAQYLQHFNKHVCKIIMRSEVRNRNFFGQMFKRKSRKVLYVLTVPEMYSIKATANMMEAAILAGIIEPKYKNNLIFIKEPAAAALYFRNHFKEFLKAANNGIGTFIVCDAGGGTVDLLTFRLDVEEDNDGNSVDKITQIGRGRGDTCGSLSIDNEFKKYIKAMFSEDLSWDIGDKSLFNEVYYPFIFEKKFVNNIKVGSFHSQL